MNSIVKILGVALVFGVYGCSISKKDDGDGSVAKLYVCSLKDLKSDVKTIPLSSLVENCELLQLDGSTDDAFFIIPSKTTVTDSYIGIRQIARKPYKLFDRSGNFLCNVGSIGQGPGEYSISLYDDIIDEKNGLIYLAIYQSDKIFVYDMSGKIKKTIVMPFAMNKPKIFLSDNTLTVVHMPLFKGEPRPLALQIDLNSGKILKELAPPEHLIIDDFSTESFASRNMLETFDFFQMKAHLNNLSDTLYHFDVKGFRLQPFFKMEPNPVKYSWYVYYQLNKDLVFTIVYGWSTMVYNQEDVKAIVATDLKNETSSYIKIVNDYYGNITIPINYFRFRNGYFIWNLQPEELMEEIEKRLAEEDCTENDRQALLKTLSSLKENDNNVVFIGKLKSETEKLW